MPQLTASENGDAGMLYDPDADLLHVWTQYPNLPCEPHHWVSEDGLTWTNIGVAGSNAPAIGLTYGDGAANTAVSFYADQAGSPDGREFNRMMATCGRS